MIKLLDKVKAIININLILYIKPLIKGFIFDNPLQKSDLLHKLIDLLELLILEINEIIIVFILKYYFLLYVPIHF